MALGKRVREARERSGLTQEELARKVGMTQAAIHALEKRDSQGSRKIAELAKALGVDMGWLANGVREAMATREPASSYHSRPNELKWAGQMEVWDSDTPIGDDEIEVPLFREVELAAGSGRTQVSENHGAKLKFAKSSLRRAGVSEDHAGCAYISGDSMARELPDGAVVGVDTADTQIRDGKLYALDHDGMLRIKQVNRMPGNGLRLVSFNDGYPDEEYTVEQVHDLIRVIGRVFWSATFW